MNVFKSTRRALLKSAPAVAAVVIVPTAATAAKLELPVDKVHRLAEELAHALDEWRAQTNMKFSAHVYSASSGRGMYFRNERIDEGPLLPADRMRTMGQL